MTFSMELGPLGERCDICKKIDESRPMLMLKTKGRTHDERNYIWVHLDEFERRLKLLKARMAKHKAAGEKVERVGTIEGVSV